MSLPRGGSSSLLLTCVGYAAGQPASLVQHRLGLCCPTFSQRACSVALIGLHQCSPRRGELHSEVGRALLATHLL